MATNDDPCMINGLPEMVRAAAPLTQDTLLRRIGRHLLALHPICAGLEGPDEEDESYLSSCEQNPWVDFQLIEGCTEHRLLDSADYEKYELMLEAWPDGFDEVIFSRGNNDEHFAEAIANTVVSQAKERSIPIKTNSDCTDERLILDMRDEFVVFIRRWRARVLEVLT